MLVAALAALVFTGAGAAVAVATSKSGTTVTRTVVSTENAATTHAGATFTTVRTIGVFAQSSSFIVARWTAESACYGGTGYCSARILIDGVEAEPVAGNDFAFVDRMCSRRNSLAMAPPWGRTRRTEDGGVVGGWIAGLSYRRSDARQLIASKTGPYAGTTIALAGVRSTR
ncbi:hypothetical protein WEI85_33325 [Actinomycetes bacterium KLBMP 9797]